MAYSWHFNTKRASDKERNPIQGEFFATDAIDNPGEALVREGIQNSLDSQDQAEKVMVRIFVSSRNNAISQEAMARDPVFISLVYPSAFRSILWRILKEEDWNDTEDPDDWRSRWLRFATNLLGVSEVPTGDDEADAEDWIEDATSAFCRHNNIRATYENYWTGARGE